MDKRFVQVIDDNGCKIISTYFPNELASMFVSHGFIAFHLPNYLMEQAI